MKKKKKNLQKKKDVDKRSSRREVHSNTGLSQETNKQNPQINGWEYHLWQIEKEKQTKAKMSIMKENKDQRGNKQNRD